MLGQYHPSARSDRLPKRHSRPKFSRESVTLSRVTSLERQSRAQLNFASRGRSFCDCPELRRVYETVWHTQVGMVERIEKLGTKLEPRRLCEYEIASYREVQSLHSRPIDRVAARIAKGEGWRRSKCRRVEPCRRRLGAGRKDRLASHIGANRVLTQDRAGVSRVSKHRHGEREAGLNLIHGGYLPVSRHPVEHARLL